MRFIVSAMALALVASPVVAQTTPTCREGIAGRSSALSSEQAVFPEMGVERTVELGQAVMFKGPLGLFLASVDLPNGATYDGSTRHGGDDRISIPAGRYDVTETDRNGISFYIPGLQPVKKNGEAYPTGQVRILYLINSKRAYISWRRRDFLTVFWDTELPASALTINYCKGRMSGGFSSEILYSGISQGTITLIYREYLDDIARPAFSQELKYDLAEGKIVGFRGARIEVIKASNTDITYRVVKPFD